MVLPNQQHCRFLPSLILRMLRRRVAALDTTRLRPYSSGFRTQRLKSTMQRPVGSVGVEALLDCPVMTIALTIIVA